MANDKDFYFPATHYVSPRQGIWLTRSDPGPRQRVLYTGFAFNLWILCCIGPWVLQLWLALISVITGLVFFTVLLVFHVWSMVVGYIEALKKARAKKLWWFLAGRSRVRIPVVLKVARGRRQMTKLFEYCREHVLEVVITSGRWFLTFANLIRTFN